MKIHIISFIKKIGSKKKVAAYTEYARSSTIYDQNPTTVNKDKLVKAAHNFAEIAHNDKAAEKVIYG